jgi:hypothetical protein
LQRIPIQSLQMTRLVASADSFLGAALPKPGLPVWHVHSSRAAGAVAAVAPAGVPLLTVGPLLSPVTRNKWVDDPPAHRLTNGVRPVGLGPAAVGRSPLGWACCCCGFAFVTWAYPAAVQWWPDGRSKCPGSFWFEAMRPGVAAVPSSCHMSEGGEDSDGSRNSSILQVTLWTVRLIRQRRVRRLAAKWLMVPGVLRPPVEPLASRPSLSLLVGRSCAFLGGCVPVSVRGYGRGTTGSLMPLHCSRSLCARR